MLMIPGRQTGRQAYRKTKSRLIHFNSTHPCSCCCFFFLCTRRIEWPIWVLSVERCIVSFCSSLCLSFDYQLQFYYFPRIQIQWHFLHTVSSICVPLLHVRILIQSVFDVWYDSSMFLLLRQFNNMRALSNYDAMYAESVSGARAIRQRERDKIKNETTTNKSK